MKKIKYIFASLLAITSLAAHATLRMPDITVTKITATGVSSNVGFKVKDSNEWLKANAEGKWTVTSTDTPVQGAIGDKNYSGFFFNTGEVVQDNGYRYTMDYALTDINDPANGIVVDPNTQGGSLLAPRRGGIADNVPETSNNSSSDTYFVIKGNNDLYVIIYNGKVYGTADIAKATKFEAYQLAYADHNVSCVQTAVPATCTAGGHNAVYQCSICQKYFKEETCETETTIADEVISALGHDYQVVKDEDGKATWTWAEDYSTATLHVVCANNAEHNDNKKVVSISEVTTQPTTSETGVLTYTAKATYGEVEYVSTKTAPIDKLPATDQAITGYVTPLNNSVTVINASNAVAEGTSAPTITVGTAAVPVTANVIITGTAANPTKAEVNVTVANGSILNIYGDGNSTVSGNVETTGGKVNITGGTINGTIKATSGAAVTLSNTNVTSTTGAAITAASGATVTIGEGRYEGKERAVSITGGNSTINVASGSQGYGRSDSNGKFTAIGGSNLRQQSGAKARRATVVDYAPAYKTIIVCDPADSHSDDKFTNQTVATYSNANGLYDHVCDKGCGTIKNDFKVVKDIYSGESDLTVNVTSESGVYEAASNVTIKDGKSNIPSGVSIKVPADKLSIERTFTAGKPSTVSLPIAEVNSLGGGKYYYFNGPILENGKITGIDYHQAIGTSDAYNKSYYPLIFVPEGTTKISLSSETSYTLGSFADATSDATVEKDGWKFIAVNEAKTWSEGDPQLGKVYGFAGQTKGNIAVGQFVMAAAGASIAEGRCYLLAPDTYNPAKGRDGSATSTSELPATLNVYFHNADETTGIAEINTETGEMSHVQWYDLNGRRIDEPTKSGIYIKGNKKVMVK